MTTEDAMSDAKCCPKCGADLVFFVSEEIGELRHTVGGFTCMENQLAAANEKLEKAEAIVAKLPKTKDGVTCVPGMRVWNEEWTDVHENGTVLFLAGGYEGEVRASESYSTREAADADRGTTP